MSRIQLPVVGRWDSEMPSFLAEDPGPAPSLALDDEASRDPALLALLAAARDALEAQATAVFPVADPFVWGMVERSLGRGEVEGAVLGQRDYRFWETVLPGLWRVETRHEGGSLDSAHLEVGPIPQVVLAASRQAPRRDLPAVELTGDGLMNAPSLVAEIRHRMRLPPGDHNHVISFTLLPLSQADMDLLEAVLGRGPVQILSRGYGTCRVQLTGARNVWSVQHFNATDDLILDTLEIGGVPEAVLAAPDDLADAATRLSHLLAHLRGHLRGELLEPRSEKVYGT